MDIITEQLRLIDKLLKKKDYNGTVKIVDDMLMINNDNLNRYLKILLELLSLITSLNRSQIDKVKDYRFSDIRLNKPNKIFKNITAENEKRDLIFHRRFEGLINNFDNWENNIYQNILKKLILLADDKEQKNKEKILVLIKNKNYERARVLLENRALRHRTKKLEQVTYILIEKIIVLVNTKKSPEINLDETKDYVQAIKNNNFELALKLIENYNSEHSINFNKVPLYFLLRDICKIIKNIKNYQNYCIDNKLLNNPEQSSNLVANKYEEIKKYGIATIKCHSKEEVAEILKDIINYPEIEGILIDNENTVVLKYSPYKDVNNNIPEKIKKADNYIEQEKIKEATYLYLEILKCENISSIIYFKLSLCFMALNNYEKALEYFNTAMEIGKNDGNDYDIYFLINNLQVMLENLKIRPVLKDQNLKFNFGLGNISEITDIIMLMKINVDEACKKLLINKEETELIKLVYAREFFSKGEIKIGEKFLKSVEQSENKTPRVVAALEEVKRCKKIYLLKKENTLELSLKLKP